jgi:hypothetical protein
MKNHWFPISFAKMAGLVLLPAFFLPACKDDKIATSAPITSTSTTSALPSAAPAASVAAPVASAAADDATTCGEMDCRLFATPEEAFASILAQKPLVIGIGESHAPKDAAEITSSTKRFTEKFLPMLVDPKRDMKASDMVLEIWVAEGQCGKKKEAAVAEKQKPVTQNQAKTNQNEYVALGDAAQAKGVKPHILRAPCADYDKILAAKEDAVIVMLEMIARLMKEKVIALSAQKPQAGSERIILTYGGAIHNDIVAREGREKWTFGPELSTLTKDRYIELDLVVPEYIRDNDAWNALPWVKHFKKDAHPTKTTLLKPRPNSYVLIFPRS